MDIYVPTNPEARRVRADYLRRLIRKSQSETAKLKRELALLKVAMGLVTLV